MKKLLLTLLCGAAVAWGAEQWKLTRFDGDNSVLAQRNGQVTVTKTKPAGEFELAGTKGLPVEPGTGYYLNFRCQVKNIDGAYVNFYLRALDARGKVVGAYLFASTPGRRGLQRDRMTRLEIPSDHFLSHQMIFKTGKKVVRVLPVYESSDGTVELLPGSMQLVKRDDPGNIAAEFTVPAGKKQWRSFQLMPRVEYCLKLTDLESKAQAQLEFFSADGKSAGKIAVTGKQCNFTVPAMAIETVLSVTGQKDGFAGMVVKDFRVNLHDGVVKNIWQGTELRRGNAKGNRVYFRRTFELEAVPEYAAIRFLGHNSAELFVNGIACGKGEQFAPGVCEITKLLKPGKNVIALRCRNSGGTLRVLFDAYIKSPGGKEQLIVSDAATRCVGGKVPEAWATADFDDSSWLPAVTGASPKDFGDSIIATRVNNRHEQLYIGAPQKLTVTPGEIPAELKLNEPFSFTVTPAATELLPSGGRIIFTAGNVNRIIPIGSIVKSGKACQITAIPQFLTPGEYLVSLSLDRALLNGKKALPLGKTAVTGQVEKPDFEVIRRDGKVLLTRNGKLIPAAMYCFRDGKSVELAELHRKTGIKLFMMNIGNIERGSDGKFDLSQVDSAMASALEQIGHDPEAHIIIEAGFMPPKRFAKREKFRRDLTKTSEGKYLRISGQPGDKKYGHPYTDLDKEPTRRGCSSVSHASKAKVKEYSEAVAALVRHCENSPFASRIAGYGIAGEMDEQWHLFAPYSGGGIRFGMTDYSDVMVDFFREHLMKKYGSDAALRQAWNDKNVTIATAQNPGYEERVGNEFFVSQRVADYNEAYALAEANLISALGRSANRELKRKALVWVYAKDSYRDVGINQFFPHVLNSGSGFEQYTSDGFNAFGNPTDYYYRRNGLHPANRGCQASAHLNKKIKLAEVDLRSYLTQAQQTPFGGENAYATEQHYRNVLMEVFQHGGSYRFYSFWLGWYNCDAVMKCMQKLSGIERAQLTLPVRWKRQVCFLYDDRAITHIGNFDGKNQRSNYFFFAKSLTAVSSTTLHRSGVGVDIYYLRDILNPEFPADQYRIYIFCASFQISPEVMAAVNRKLRRNGNVLIFPWGSGFLNSKHQPDRASVEQLTGIKVAPHRLDRKHGGITRTAATHLLTSSWDKNATVAMRNRYNITPQLPMFVVADHAAQVWGKFGDGSDALAVKKVGDSYSVYCAAPDFSAGLLRSICRAKQVHCFVDNGYDFVATDGNFLSIHSGAGGMKTVNLPEKIVKAVDWFTGKVLAENTNTLKLRLRDDETVVLKLEYK